MEGLDGDRGRQAGGSGLRQWGGDAVLTAAPPGGRELRLEAQVLPPQTLQLQDTGSVTQGMYTGGVDGYRSQLPRCALFST